jgi:Calcineurin-like phosphoesterase
MWINTSQLLIKGLLCILLLNINILNAQQNQSIGTITSVNRNGLTIVRVITHSTTCPSLIVDTQKQAMNVRVNAYDGTLAKNKPAVFPELVCELTLPASTQQVSFESKILPKVISEPKKIVLLGDTGCRMKAPDEFQSCENSLLWPLAKVAASAAAEKPDLVIHVGDYHYRESECSTPGCRKSPYGYGFDTWNADFFEPMQPLLEAAPWVFTRGNHESCQRAGQGWFRYLDPDPFDIERACYTKNSVASEFSSPYAVSLGPEQQLIIFDSANASEKLTKDSDHLIRSYQDQFKEVAKLAERKPKNWLVAHHPLLGYGYSPNIGFEGGNLTLIKALEAEKYEDFVPKNIQLTLQGHIHTFELNSFEKNVPISLITGFGGSLLEPIFTEPLPAHFEMAKGISTTESLSSQNYGYTTLEKIDNRWELKQKDMNGKTHLTCHLELDGSPEKFSCKPNNE